MSRAAKDGLRPLTSEEWRTLERVRQASSERVDRVRRARAVLAVAAGQSFTQAHAEIIQWVEDTVEGWNAAPTPFVWHGKRWQRRLRARQHRLGGSEAALDEPQAIAA